MKKLSILQLSLLLLTTPFLAIAAMDGEETTHYPSEEEACGYSSEEMNTIEELPLTGFARIAAQQHEKSQWEKVSKFNLRDRMPQEGKVHSPPSFRPLLGSVEETLQELEQEPSQSPFTRYRDSFKEKPEKQKKGKRKVDLFIEEEEEVARAYSSLSHHDEESLCDTLRTASSLSTETYRGSPTPSFSPSQFSPAAARKFTRSAPTLPTREPSTPEASLQRCVSTAFTAHFEATQSAPQHKDKKSRPSLTPPSTSTLRRLSATRSPSVSSPLSQISSSAPSPTPKKVASKRKSSEEDEGKAAFVVFEPIRNKKPAIKGIFSYRQKN